MLNVYALISDKGGTGRSVVGCNLAYRLAAGVGDEQVRNVAYIDLDLGSATSGSVFWIPGAETGVDGPAMHDWLLHGLAPDKGTSDFGSLSEIDVWAQSLRFGPGFQGNRGDLLLYPGAKGGADLSPNAEHLAGRMSDLFESLRQERGIDTAIVDMRAGRSAVSDGLITLSALQQAGGAPFMIRWIVFHRWTPQSAHAGANLISGPSGLLSHFGAIAGDGHQLDYRVVRTAVPTVDEWQTDAQDLSAIVEGVNRKLEKLVKESGSLDKVLHEVGWDPLLQWREQIVLPEDVDSQEAREQTVEDLDGLARELLIWQESGS